jgi:hypothetical protein
MRQLAGVVTAVRDILTVDYLRHGEPVLGPDGSPRTLYLWQALRFSAPVQFFKLQTRPASETGGPTECFAPLVWLVAVDEGTKAALYTAPVTVHLAADRAGVTFAWPGLGQMHFGVAWEADDNAIGGDSRES